jgi:methylmalonyl-CoA mutase
VVASNPVPTVLLVPLGPAAEHAARSTFAGNLFGVAGIRAVQSGDLAGGAGASGLADPGPAQSGDGGFPIAVLCGSDERYSTEAATAAGELKAAGVQRVYLAGRPGDDEDDLRASGVDEFIHVGVDVVDVLSRALDHLGVDR